MKKLYFILIIFGLIYSAPITTPKNCRVLEINEFEPLGDTGGNIIFTKKEIVFECNQTQTINGKCLKWDEKYEERGLTDNHDLIIRSSDYSDSIGSLFKKLGLLNKFNSIFGGWRGTCLHGTEIDLDWMGDPMYLAGLATTFAFNKYGQAWGDKYASSFGVTQNVGRMIVGATGCLIGAGLKMSDTFGNDDDECDPVDEFCGEESTTEEDILTMNESEFVELQKEMASNSNWNKYLKITELHKDNGYVTYRVDFKNLPLEMDAAKAEEAMKEAKEAMKGLRVAMAVISAGVCIWGAVNGKNVSVGAKSNSAATSASSLIKMAASWYLGPWGQLFSTIIIDIISSINKIDSCNNEDDAEEKGARHVATYEMTHLFRERMKVDFDLCHFIREEEVASNGPFFPSLYRKHYCCYSDILSKTLTVQIKAQLGKNWTHCTDISLEDFVQASEGFRDCTTTDKATGPDGVTLPWDADYDTRMTAYQAKAKCMDLQEFTDYFQALVGDKFRVDITDIEDALEDLEDQVLE